MLDLGTGTGSWALDFGDVHPTASVLGTDLSPIQPRSVPPNVKFEVDDVCDEWVYAVPFDFIHIRGLYGSVGDWDQLYAQAQRTEKGERYTAQTPVDKRHSLHY